MFDHFANHIVLLRNTGGGKKIVTRLCWKNLLLRWTIFAETLMLGWARNIFFFLFVWVWFSSVIVSKFPPVPLRKYQEGRGWPQVEGLNTLFKTSDQCIYEPVTFKQCLVAMNREPWPKEIRLVEKAVESLGISKAAATLASELVWSFKILRCGTVAGKKGQKGEIQRWHSLLLNPERWPAGPVKCLSYSMYKSTNNKM